MPDFLIHVEAVNLDPFISDSSDLSTIRGAGLLLLRAVRDLAQMDWGLGFQPDLEPVSTGASVGLYRLTVDDRRAADTVAAAIERVLDTDPRFKHATFRVACRPLTEDYSDDGERLLAHVRWGQLQSPTTLCRDNTGDWWSVVGQDSDRDKPPSQPANRDQKPNRLACAVDHLRPATHWPINLKTKSVRVSASTAVRKAFGIEQKRAFYRQLFDERGNAKGCPERFANEFSQLGKTSRCAPAGGELGSIQRKMAVIYLDGNSFGSTIGKHVRDPESHETIDNQMRSSRAEFMTGFLTRFREDPFWITNDGRFQLETLLWGGDEILWVVPAWQGWQMVHRFLDDWKIDQGPLADEWMTHAVGVVFCSVKTPIHRVKSLAKDLAESAKGRSRKHNLIAYEVLESFDHTGTDLQRHRDRRTPFRPVSEPRTETSTTKSQSTKAAPTKSILPSGAGPVREMPTAVREAPVAVRGGDPFDSGMRQRRNLDGKKKSSKGGGAKPKPRPKPQPDVKLAEPDPEHPGQRLVLTTDQWEHLDKLCAALKRVPDFRRGRLRDLALRSVGNLEESQQAAIRRQCESLLTQDRTLVAHPDAIASAKEAAKYFGGTDYVMLCWHLNELWSYIGLPSVKRSPAEMVEP